MLQHLRPALVMLVAFTLLTGVAYPLAITGIAQVAMPDAANGSLVVKDGKVIGSSLVGQCVHQDDKYFHPRPSATSDTDPADPTKTVDAPYNAAASTGSNLGPITQKLIDRVKGDVEALRKARRHRADPGRRRHDVRERPRSATSRRRPRSCRCRASPRRANLPEERVRALVQLADRGPGARLPRRAAR